MTYSGINIIKANKNELGFLSENKIIEEKSLKKSILKIYTDVNLDVLIVTLAEDGCLLYNGEDFLFEKSYADNFVDVTGAGDSFFSTFISFYNTYKDFGKALRFASYSSAITLNSIGCYSPSSKEILNFKK